MRATLFIVCLFVLAPVEAMQSPQAASRDFAEVVRLTTNPDRGKSIYSSCSSCHGPDGGGTPSGTVPAIAGQHARVIARQLIDYRYAQRWDAQMEQVASQHNLQTAQDIADVSAFISRLSRVSAHATGDGLNASLGRRVYQTSCAGCHGASAEGSDALLVPRLAGQHHGYLLRQLHDALDGNRPNLPAPHQNLLVGIPAADLTGLADHISRIGAGTAR